MLTQPSLFTLKMLRVAGYRQPILRFAMLYVPDKSDFVSHEAGWKFFWDFGRTCLRKSLKKLSLTRPYKATQDMNMNQVTKYYQGSPLDI